MLVVRIAVLLSFLAVVLSQRPFTVNDLHNINRLSGPSVSPNGKTAAYSVRFWNKQTKKTTVHLELVDIATGNVTVFTTPSEGQQDSEPIWSPNSDVIVFVSTRSGSSQLWYSPVAVPNPVQLTNYPTDDLSNLKWAKTGAFITFTTSVYIDCAQVGILNCTASRDSVQAALGPNTGFLYSSLYVRHWASWETPGKHPHIFAQNVVIAGTTITLNGDPRDLMIGMPAASPIPPFGGGEQYDISPDGTQVAFTAEMIQHDTAWTTGWRIYTVQSAGGQPIWISENGVPAGVRTTNPVYQPNGNALAYLAMDRPGLESDRLHINIYDLQTGTTRPLTANWDRSISEISWSNDGNYLFATATDVGYDKLFLIEVSNGAVHPLISQGSNTGATAVGNTVILSRNSLQTPADIWAVTVDFNSKTAQGAHQLTQGNNQLLAQFQFNQPEQFFFIGSYGDKVQGWIIKPYGFDPTKKYPVVFLIHGGPEGAWEDAWSYRWNPQLWANHGYAVVMINPHGSTGMGQNFTDAVRNDWGGAPYMDLMKGLDYALGTYTYLDSSKVCACGASYGGYMINWIAGQTHRFSCLVNHDGVFDTMAMYYGTEEIWFPESEYCPLKERGCTPWQRPEGFERWNPRNFVKNWITPMLVIHGGRDFRIPESEGLSTFTALQRRGIPSKLLYFPMESHWVLNPDNGIMWYNNVLGWIDSWIGPKK
jgi:dipeptidyl aminopeptidase/acylaminoacyl peptidase